MGEEVKVEVIRTTQDCLSKYIKKPPLTEKLLRKPPFRYLHDITTAVMRETGYLQGLFSQDEMNPENIKDREAKIAFLEKLIAAVNLSTGVNITARPNKIVAGLDVTKTNELLQTIAKALEKKIDSSEAVDLILNKKTKGQTQQNATKKESIKVKATKETKAPDNKAREPRSSDTSKKKIKEKTKQTEKEKPEARKGKTKKDVSPTKLSKAPSVEEPSGGSTKEEPKQREKAKLPDQSSIDKESSEKITENSASDPESKHNLNPPPTVTTSNEVIPPSEQPRDDKAPSRSRGVKTENRTSELEPLKEVQEMKRGDSLVDREAARGQSDVGKENKPRSEEDLKRPQSARAVHRRKSSRKQAADGESLSPHMNSESNQELAFNDISPMKPKEPPLVDKGSNSSMLVMNEREEGMDRATPAATKRPRTAARPASARPGAPRVRDRGIAQVTELDNKVVSEPVNLIVDTKGPLDDDDLTLVTVEAPTVEAVADQVVDESHLLSVDQGHLVSQILETQKELEDNTAGTETLQKVDISWSSGRQEAVEKEVEKLRTAIQSLTRAANPLGKLIDFLQEDIDAMQTELETWTHMNQQLATQLQAEERLTEESIEPLVRQLEDISQLVEEQLEEMSVVKATILRNDERITKLLKANTSRLPG